MAFVLPGAQAVRAPVVLAGAASAVAEEVAASVAVAAVLAGEEHQAHGNKDRYNTDYYPA